ncbi:MAG: Gmad2 immunoglobulin-like domain-containing protein [Candidatus Uhrbacteria bacterium]
MTRISWIFLLTVLIFGGFGCVEEALKYPKDYSEFVIKNSGQLINQNSETIKLIGVVSFLENSADSFQLTLTDGSTENIKIASDVTISLNSQTAGIPADLSTGWLAEIFGTRDLTNLIVTARTIRIINSQSIFIIAPEANATVTSPLIVSGFTNLQTSNISWHIKDKENNSLSTGTQAFTPIANSFSPFRLEIFLPVLASNSFALEIFSLNPQTNLEESLTTLLLNLLSINQSELNIFFINDRLNTSRTCNTVFPIKRLVAETSATGRASLLKILNGPTESESREGYRSGLLFNTTINSFVISGGVATVTVSNDLKKLSSCEKQLAEEQIRQTLLQIRSIKDVVIRTE